MGCGGAGSLQAVEPAGGSQGRWRAVSTVAQPRPARPVTTRRVAARIVVVGLAAVLGVATPALAGAAAAQGDPEPTTPTTEPTPTTTSPTTTPPTTEAPTTLPPTTEAPEPTSPPTTSGGGGGRVGPTTPTTVATTATSTAETVPRSTLVAPAPGAVTVPQETSPGDGEPADGPWLTPTNQLRVAVGGLGALAAVMVGLTVAYWRHTQPALPLPLVGVGSDAPRPPAPTRRPRRQGRRRANGERDAVGAGVAASTALPESPGEFSAAPPSALPPPRFGVASPPAPLEGER